MASAIDRCMAGSTEVDLSDRIVLVPGKASLSVLERVLSTDSTVALDRSFRPGVEAALEVVRRAAAGKEAVYGVNTGFGKLATVRIPAEDTAALQRNLILSHCCGVGEPLPERIVRLVIALKILSLGRGASGVGFAIIELLEAMLERGVVPVIPSKGSVGASGDLAPLAHLAAVLIGEGRAEFAGRSMQGGEALKAAGLAPVVLGPKEGLGLINGTQVSAALALAGLFDTWRMVLGSLAIAALSTDAMMGSTAPLRPELHALRGHAGQRDAARAMRAMLTGSAIRESHREGDDRVQDPYCIRCAPQVAGAVIDLLRGQARILATEANAVTDNPLVILPSGEILSGGNFHAEPVAFAADIIALAIAECGSISQRRTALMVDPTLSHGLPPFLARSPGLHSGFMIAEVTAAALMSENKQRAHPASIDSTPTSANQEDHVSMACHAALRLDAMNANLAHILGVELMAATEGVGYRAPLKTSETLQRIVAEARNHIAPLSEDRALSGDMAAAAALLRSGRILALLPEDILPGLEGMA